jgi:cytochrome c-type biogenesis protein CcmE
MELTPRHLDDPESPDALGDGEGDDAAEPGGAGGAGGAGRVRTPRSSRRGLVLGVVAVLVLALGFLVYKGLSDATVYFRNADEAVAERASLGDRRFRLQGTVVDDAVETDDGVNFDVTYKGVDVAVHHVGDPPELFKPGIPVVLEGSWDPAGGDFFASDRMFIKHDATYESKDDYDQRIREAEQGGEDGGEGDGGDEGGAAG